MPRTKPSYPPEFKRQMVELVRSGWSIESFAVNADLDCPQSEEETRLGPVHGQIAHLIEDEKPRIDEHLQCSKALMMPS